MCYRRWESTIGIMVIIIILDDDDDDDTDDTNMTRRCLELFDLLRNDNFKLRDSDLVQIEFQDDLVVYLLSFRGLALLLLIRHCCSWAINHQPSSHEHVTCVQSQALCPFIIIGGSVLSLATAFGLLLVNWQFEVYFWTNLDYNFAKQRSSQFHKRSNWGERAHHLFEDPLEAPSGSWPSRSKDRSATETFTGSQHWVLGHNRSRLY